MSDPLLRDIVLVDQLPSDAWAEGLAIRPGGEALATRIDGTEIYGIPSTSETESNEFNTRKPRLVANFPTDTTSNVGGICQLTDTDHESYGVVTCSAEFSTGSFTNVALWRVEFDPDDEDDAGQVSKIADLPDAGFPLGIIVISDDIVAIADTTVRCIWRIRLSTGEVNVLYKNTDTMEPETEGELFGVNRVRVAAGFIWYTNTTTGKFWRAPVKWNDDNTDIEISGSPELLAEGFPNADGLVMHRDGSAGYISSFTRDKVWKVAMDKTTGCWETSILRDNMITPTAMQLLYSDDEKKPILYIMCCGAVSPDVLEGDRGVGLNLAGVDKSRLKIIVTVTTEITVTYEPLPA